MSEIITYKGTGFKIGKDWSQRGNVYQAGQGLTDNFSCLKEFVQDIFENIHNTNDHKILTEQLVKLVTKISQDELSRCVHEESINLFDDGANPQSKELEKIVKSW